MKFRSTKKANSVKKGENVSDIFFNTFVTNASKRQYKVSNQDIMQPLKDNISTIIGTKHFPSKESLPHLRVVTDITSNELSSAPTL